MEDETAKDNHETAAWISHELYDSDILRESDVELSR